MSSSLVETTEELYRRQGEQQMFEFLMQQLEELYQEKPNASWSPKYIMSFLKGKNEARTNSN